MLTTKQTEVFAELINDEITATVSKTVLQIAIDYIADNFSPDDIFPQKELENWAENNGWTQE